MSEATFKVKYDGPALAQHAMDVRDLAPTLLSTGDICRDANRQVNGDSSKVDVLINPEADQGSFIAGLFTLHRTESLVA